MRFYLDLSFVPGPQMNEIFNAINLIPHRLIGSQEINSVALPQYVELELQNLKGALLLRAGLKVL